MLDNRDNQCNNTYLSFVFICCIAQPVTLFRNVQCSSLYPGRYVFAVGGVPGRLGGAFVSIHNIMAPFYTRVLANVILHSSKPAFC